jgi:hypothetical protein
VKKILTLISIPVIFLLIFLPQFFIRVNISCESQYGECPQTVLDKISTLKGKKLTTAKKKLNEILKSDFSISTYSFRFRLPNTLHVELLVKKPLFAIKNMSSGVNALVDKDGQVLENVLSSALPTVTTDEALPDIGQKVSDKNFFALRLMSGVYQMYQIGMGKVQGETLLVDLAGPVRVIFPLVDADRDILLGSLRLIYSNIKGSEGGSLYREVDMRYKNPVLR